MAGDIQWDCAVCEAVADLRYQSLPLPVGEQRIRALHAERSHSDDCPISDHDEVTYTLSNKPGARIWDRAPSATIAPRGVERRSVTITDP